MIAKIQATNFLSWKSLDFSLVPGITLIDGWNEDDQTSEGSGKSAILNAMSWALYGKLPKDVKIDEVITKGEKSCEVVLIFENNDRIVRSRKPNDLYLLKNENVIKGKDAKETQTLIEDYVGLSFETFCQTIYFAQNYDKKFISATQEEKTKILSEVQDLNIFEKARKLAVTNIKVYEAQILEAQNTIQLARKQQEVENKTIEFETYKISKAQADRDLAIKNFEAALTNEKQELNKVSSKQSEVLLWLNEAKSAFQPIDTTELETQKAAVLLRSQEINQQIANYNKLKSERELKERQATQQGKQYQKLKAEQSHLIAYLENPVNICPTCKHESKITDLSGVHSRLQELSTEASQIETLVQTLVLDIQSPLPEMSALEAERIKIQYEIFNLSKGIDDAAQKAKLYQEGILKAEATIEQLGYTIRRHESQISKIANDLEILITSPLELDYSKIDEAKAKIAQIEADCKHIADEIKYKHNEIVKLETLKKAFKEVKLFVFNSILEEINHKANEYLQKLFEVPISINFANVDMKIDTTVIFNNEPISLGLLSGGQYRRTMLAVDLALSDVIIQRKGSKLGVLILDEYFRDLSETSMEKCLELLQERKTPVLLIEHNSIFKSIVDNSFFVKLHNGISTAVQV